MKVSVKNNGTAPYGVELVGGGYKFIAPGKERTVDAATPGRLYEIDFLEVVAIESQVPEIPASLSATVTKGDPFDHDGKGGPGGSLKGKASTAAKGARRRRRKAAPK